MSGQGVAVDLENGPRRKRASRYVYFLLGENSGLIKIGRARDVAQRFSALKTGSAEALTLLGVIHDADPERLEMMLHDNFRPYRTRGEWFQACPALLAFIERHAISLDEERERIMAEAVARFAPAQEAARKALGGARSRKARLEAYKLARGLTA